VQDAWGLLKAPDRFVADLDRFATVIAFALSRQRTAIAIASVIEPIGQAHRSRGGSDTLRARHRKAAENQLDAGY